MKTPFRRLLTVTAITALAVSLAGCGPDDSQQSHAQAALLSQAAPQPGWSMADLASVDPAFVGGNAAPLPQAVPMRAAYRGRYDYAPAYDYGPEPYDDDGYYAPDPRADDYQWLALAGALAGMLGNAPPDYAFGYDGVQPWAWETGDRYMRYAEPIDGGYRYYYYEPDSERPFLVSDPYYSYGYRDDRLVAIYDRQGRVIDARRAQRQRQAAQDYFARAEQMYLAAHREPRVGVAAPLWQQRREQIASQQRQWDQARRQRQAWQAWDAQNQQRLHRDWAGEALVRREAERSFGGWQKADFRTPAPKFYTPQQRQVQLQKVAEIRRDEQLTAQRRAAQNQRRQAVVAQQQQRLASAERAQQQVAQQRQQAQAREAALQRQQAAQQRQADAQLARERQQQQAEAQKVAQQRRTQAERADAQRQAQAQRQAEAQKAQQQARVAAAKRQQAAREHQLEAQRAAQQREAQKAQQTRAAQQKAQQARAAQQREAQKAQQTRAAQQKAQQARAAQQQAQQVRAAQQRQAQQARVAQQRQAQQARVAQQARIAQQKAQQTRVAQQQKQAAERAAAAKQRSAGQAQAAQGGSGCHGRGHGRDRG